MPSLDGYSLNEKMDKLHDDVQCQIDQLKVDFHNLYEELKKVQPKAKPKKKKELVVEKG